MFPASSWGPADSAMSWHPNQPSAKKAAVAGALESVFVHIKDFHKRIGKTHNHLPLRGREGGSWLNDGQPDRDHFLSVFKEITVVTTAGTDLHHLLWGSFRSGQNEQLAALLTL
ncbi:hypothetical protein Q8A73_004130 [Channa argus]|nr:hypothetical protein Q8A73_004130 [Channa argus]